jgi:hypothetical protein
MSLISIYSSIPSKYLIHPFDSTPQTWKYFPVLIVVVLCTHTDIECGGGTQICKLLKTLYCGFSGLWRLKATARLIYCFIPRITFLNPTTTFFIRRSPFLINGPSCWYCRSSSSSSSYTNKTKPLGQRRIRMGTRSIVIGVSGITCGGKTTITKLLQRAFPWSKIIHQDNYFYDDDSDKHVRLPEAENHVNYEIDGSMDMDKMCRDIETVLRAFREGVEDNYVNPDDTPNFNNEDELLKKIDPIGTLCRNI